MTDDYIGYFKFYFDHYVDGEVVEHYRIDLGDGEEVNEREFSYLEEQGVHAVNVEGGMNAWGDEGTVIDNI